jgi:hypothetical protein
VSAVICVTSGPLPITRAQYYEIGEEIPDPPEGRDYHVCHGDDGALFITEVWESEEHLMRHNESLAEVLAGAFGDPFGSERTWRPVVGIQRRGELPVKVDG